MVLFAPKAAVLPGYDAAHASGLGALEVFSVSLGGGCIKIAD